MRLWRRPELYRARKVICFRYMWRVSRRRLYDRLLVSACRIILAHVAPLAGVPLVLEGGSCGLNRSPLLDYSFVGMESGARVYVLVLI